jgi:sugar O-acyltransferase (sialic acid O-acetyltransferase NeuD family)
LKEIYIYGAGGYGAELVDLVRSINRNDNRWLIAGFFDDNKTPGTEVSGIEVLGDLDEMRILAAATGELHLVLAFGDPHLRKKVRESLDGMNIIYPSLIHPNVILGEDVHLAEGNIINANVVVSRSTRLDAFCLVNFNAVLGHDLHLGAFCSIMGGAQIGGEVDLGSGTFVGLNASILQGLKTGERCLIAAGAVLNTSIEDDMAVLGERSKIVHYNKSARKRNS